MRKKYGKARHATDDNVGEYGACALLAGHLRRQTYPQNINTYFSCPQQQLLRLYARGLSCLLWQLNNAQSPAGSMILPHIFSTCVTNVVSGNVLK